MKKVLGALLLASGLVACGGGGDVTGSSGTSYPQVAGNYSGSVTVVYPELAVSFVCPASTAVTQSGGNVSLAPLVLSGQCGGLSIPFGSTTIDTTGSMGNVSGTTSGGSCGTYSYTASGGFFGRELRMSMNATSNTCWNFNFSTTLTR